MTTTNDEALVAELRRLGRWVGCGCEPESGCREAIVRDALPRLLAMADEAIVLREVRDAAAWARSEWNEVAAKATCDVDYLGDLRGSMNSLDRALDKYVKKLSERAALDADAARGKS